MLTHQAIIFRVLFGAFLGGVIGFERDRHRRLVGLRTHFIVALTSATFMVISTQFVYYQQYGQNDLVEVDASRIAASVVSAVGFLAGGAILRTGVTIQGLTTAAGLWLVTAIGMCSGSGMYDESVAVTIIGLLGLTILRRLEDKHDDVVKRRVTLTIRRGDGAVQTLMRNLAAAELAVKSVAYEHTARDDERVTLTLEISCNAAIDVAALVEKLEGCADVCGIGIADT